jgi:hypothetical protein
MVGDLSVYIYILWKPHILEKFKDYRTTAAIIITKSKQLEGNFRRTSPRTNPQYHTGHGAHTLLYIYMMEAAWSWLFCLNKDECGNRLIIGKRANFALFLHILNLVKTSTNFSSEKYYYTVSISTTSSRL